jgi:hypothetical protein
MPLEGTRAEFLLLTAIALPLLFSALGLSFLDPDEGLYGDMAQTMSNGVGLVVPHFNGLPYLEKPPLYLWLAATSLRLDVPVEWALRAWSALAAFGSVLLAWRIGDRLYGRGAGLLAGIALTTMAGTALYIRKGSTDFLFVFCLTLAMYGFLRGGNFLWMYTGMALGVMTKGLIGVVLPVLIVGVSLLVIRRLSWRDLNLARGGAVFAALVVPWHAAAAWSGPEHFSFYILDNQVLRFLNVRGFIEDDVPIRTLAFLIVSFVWLFPWGVFVLSRREPGGAAPAVACRPLIVIWALIVIAFFALSRSKLEYYALPAFPAIAILAGAAWVSGRDVGRWLMVGLAGCVLVGGATLWVGARLTPDQALWGLAELNVYYRILREQGRAFPFESARPFGFLLQALGVTLIAGWALATCCWLRRWRWASFGSLAAMASVIAVLIVQLLVLVEPHHSAKAVAEAINARAEAHDVIVHENSLEYSAALPLYTGRRIVVVNGVRGDLEFASRLPEARGWFLDDAGLRALWAAPGRVFLVTQHSPDRTVLATFPAESLHSLGRFGSRSLYSNRKD